MLAKEKMLFVDGDEWTRTAYRYFLDPVIAALTEDFSHAVCDVMIDVEVKL